MSDIHNGPLEGEHPIWAREVLQLRSVGIDIGSSTSHLVFSDIVLRRMGRALSSRFEVVQRHVAYASGVLLTPYRDGSSIHTRDLSAFITRAYQEAAIDPQVVDTGAVIITGEAAKKENARGIIGMFAQQSGRFVCATAGPNLEAMMAAYGSGAVSQSLGEGREGRVVMNIDVGGGSSKVAIVKDGLVVDTAATNVGARLLTLDGEGRLCRIEGPGVLVARSCGFELELGQTLPQAVQQAIAQTLADCLFQLLERRPLSPLARDLMLTPPLHYSGKIDLALFSGGVSEYIYGYEEGDYGDLGKLLGREIRARASRGTQGAAWGWPLQRIRATAIGASQYTAQVSGSTIFLSAPGLLPLRSLQVLAPHIGGRRIGAETVRRAIRESVRRFDLDEEAQPVALAIHWPFGPAYPLLRALARGVVSAMRRSLRAGLPLVLVFDADIARLVGALLAQELGPGQPIVCIDGIQLRDFDYVDIGGELPQVGAVPVVIKSLVFPVGPGIEPKPRA